MSDTADRLAIHEAIARLGHLIDEGAEEALAEVLAPDVRYDVTGLGGKVLEGLAAFWAAALALGALNPLAHHVTNVVVTRLEGDRAEAISKGLGVRADGTVGTVTYVDELARGAGGWRILRRTVRARAAPLQP